MTRSELIFRLSRQFPHLSTKQVTKAVNTILNGMGGHLAEGGRIELRGFGAFSVREREAREARNPKTGEKVKVGLRHSLYFRPGKDLRQKVNKGSS